jgi:hypothetical protein
MKTTSYGLATLLFILCTGCFRNDLRTETFELHQLRTPDSVRLVGQPITQIAGVKEIRPDLANRRLTVVFNGLECYRKNIEAAIASAGFDQPNRPADPAAKARLPEELR